MPRPNPTRVVPHEANLAKRIRFERESRGLTYERLAQKMTEAGCAMQGSAIYKIENGDPPRRITLDEAVTFAQIFGLKLGALLIPVEVAATREALALWKEYDKASQQVRTWQEEADRLGSRLVDLADGNTSVLDALNDLDPDAGLHISAEKALIRGRQIIKKAEGQ